MSRTRIMRLLRFKHNLSLAELARAAKISAQRVSQIELSEDHPTEYQQELIYEAFAIIAQERANTALHRDLHKPEYRLLDYAREDETV